jgi:pyruvate/oxaloacetate carboxyltransferase
VHTSIAPLANGPAQPATQTIARNLRGMGYRVDLDERLIDEVSEHFRRVAEQEGKPLGAPMELSDEERLLRYSFAGSQVDEMIAASDSRNRLGAEKE